MLFQDERGKLPEDVASDQTGPRKKSTIPNQSPDSTVAMFTGLMMLLAMRRKLGLEAMLEYMDAYQGCIASSNPHFVRAVQAIINQTDVQKIYGDMCNGGDGCEESLGT